MEHAAGLVAQSLRDLADHLDRAASGGGLLLALIYILSATAAALALIGLLRRALPRRGAEDAGLRERLDHAELRLQGALGDVALAEKQNLRLSEHSPKTFLKRVQLRSEADGAADGGEGQREWAERWLEPMRPALAEAYAILARHRLATANDAEDVEAARMLAMGAVAAAPARAACAELLISAEEAARLKIFDAMSETDMLAWKILRLSGHGASAGASDHPDARSLIERSRHRVGRAMRLSGWATEDLRAAALAQLTRPERGIVAAAEMASAVPSQFRSARAAARSLADVQGEAAAGGPDPALAEGWTADLEAAFALVSGQRLWSPAPGDGHDGGLALQEAPAKAAGNAHGPADAGPKPRASRGRSGRKSAKTTGAPEAEAPAPPAPPVMSEEEAELRRLWDRRRDPTVLGENHPRTLTTRANLAHEIGRQGRHAEAEAEFRAVRDILRRPGVLGQTHPDTLTAWHNMAHEIACQGRHADARAEFDALAGVLMSNAGPGATHPLTLAARHGLAAALAALGRAEEAEAEFRAVWDIRRSLENLGEDHPQTLWTRIQMLNAAGEAAAG